MCSLLVAKDRVLCEDVRVGEWVSVGGAERTWLPRTCQLKSSSSQGLGAGDRVAVGVLDGDTVGVQDNEED